MYPRGTCFFSICNAHLCKSLLFPSPPPLRLDTPFYRLCLCFPWTPSELLVQPAIRRARNSTPKKTNPRWRYRVLFSVRLGLLSYQCLFSVWFFFPSVFVRSHYTRLIICFPFCFSTHPAVWIRLPGHICNWSTNFSCDFWSRPIFSRPSPNVSSTRSSSFNSWNCSTAKILASETFSKRRYIEYTANSWVWGPTSESRSTISFTRYPLEKNLPTRRS